MSQLAMAAVAPGQDFPVLCQPQSYLPGKLKPNQRKISEIANEKPPAYKPKKKKFAVEKNIQE